MATKICVTCGKEYEAKSANQKYCNWYTCSPGRTELGHRWRILDRDGFRCAYCGASSLDDDVKLHLDHIVPIAKGGLDIASNMVTSCKECNLSKGKRRMGTENEVLISAEVKRRNAINNIPDSMPMNNGRYLKGSR